MYILYTITYITSIVVYFILYNIIDYKFIQSNMCCLFNDILFYINLLLYIIVITTIFKDKKGMFVGIGAGIILLRFILIEYFSKFFSNYFGFSAIEYESNNVFFKLMNDSNNYLTKIYSKYGPIINNIDYKPIGLHSETAGKPNLFKKIFFDFIYQNKKYEVSEYFLKILNLTDVNDDIEKVIGLLDKKFLVSKFIWNVILITILFSLSLKYI